MKTLKALRSLGHKDGWGIVHFDRGMPIYLDRQPTDAFQDKRYVEALERMNSLLVSGVLLAHLRRRSVGAVSMENTLPFIHKVWAFVQNGTVYNLDAEIERERKGPQIVSVSSGC